MSDLGIFTGTQQCTCTMTPKDNCFKGVKNVQVRQEKIKVIKVRNILKTWRCARIKMFCADKTADIQVQIKFICVYIKVLSLYQWHWSELNDFIKWLWYHSSYWKNWKQNALWEVCESKVIQNIMNGTGLCM